MSFWEFFWKKQPLEKIFLKIFPYLEKIISDIRWDGVLKKRLCSRRNFFLVLILCARDWSASDFACRKELIIVISCMIERYFFQMFSLRTFFDFDWTKLSDWNVVTRMERLKTCVGSVFATALTRYFVCIYIHEQNCASDWAILPIK